MSGWLFNNHHFDVETVGNKWKSVCIWRIYGQEWNGTFFSVTVHAMFENVIIIIV